MKESISPPARLTVIIEDLTPLIHWQGQPARRSVRIQLTPEQLEALSLRYTGHDRGTDLYEQVACCFLEGSE